MKMNLALAQIAPKLGDVEANCEKHLDYIKQARKEKADLLSSPSFLNRIRRTGSGRLGRAPNQGRMIPSSNIFSKPAGTSTLWWVSWTRTCVTASTLPLPTSPRDVFSMCITKCTCRPTACSMRGASSPGADSIRSFDTRFGPRRFAHLRRLLACLAAIFALARRRGHHAVLLCLPGPRSDRPREA